MVWQLKDVPPQPVFIPFQFGDVNDIGEGFVPDVRRQKQLDLTVASLHGRVHHERVTVSIFDGIFVLPYRERRVDKELDVVLGEFESGNEFTGICDQLLAILEINSVPCAPFAQTLGTGEHTDAGLRLETLTCFFLDCFRLGIRIGTERLRDDGCRHPHLVHLDASFPIDVTLILLRVLEVEELGRTCVVIPIEVRERNDVEKFPITEVVAKFSGQVAP